jgi:glutaredoxin 2
VKYYIECKGSVSNTEEFFLTKNEWQFYLQNRNNYRLYFVSDINSQNPTIHRIEDLLKDMEEGKLIPCSSVNRKVKADRILFQINQ